MKEKGRGLNLSFFDANIIEERGSTMQVLNRLKMELSNQEYFTGK